MMNSEAMWTRLPSIRVLTPVLNGAALIQDTVRSVVEQSAVADGRVRLDYTVLDAGSTDGTADRAHEAAQGRAEVDVRSDAGMYDAIARGFRQRRGDICFYLNAGDVLLPGALDALVDVMAPGRARWVCGWQVHVTASGVPVRARLPYRFRRRALASGIHVDMLPYVQQESTFWHGDLLDTVDFDVLASLKLAGDFYLWKCFAQVADLVVIDALLGGFRLHGGHLSDAHDRYLAEVRSLAEPLTPSDRIVAAFDRLAWQAPPRIKKMLNPNGIWLFDTEAGTWR